MLPVIATSQLISDGLALAQAAPTIDGIYIVQLLSRILHILSAIILVGGLFYLKTVLLPAGTEAWFAGRRGVWARWVGIATFLLIGTGLYNFLVIVRASKAAGEAVNPTYHALFGVKFILALVVFFLAAILAGKTQTADKFRTNMSRWLGIAWLAALAIVTIAAIMRTYH